LPLFAVIDASVVVFSPRYAAFLLCLFCRHAEFIAMLSAALYAIATPDFQRAKMISLQIRRASRQLLLLHARRDTGDKVCMLIFSFLFFLECRAIFFLPFLFLSSQVCRQRGARLFLLFPPSFMRR